MPARRARPCRGADGAITSTLAGPPGWPACGVRGKDDALPDASEAVHDPREPLRPHVRLAVDRRDDVPARLEPVLGQDLGTLARDRSEREAGVGHDSPTTSMPPGTPSASSVSRERSSGQRSSAAAASTAIRLCSSGIDRSPLRSPASTARRECRRPAPPRCPPASSSCRRRRASSRAAPARSPPRSPAASSRRRRYGGRGGTAARAARAPRRRRPTARDHAPVEPDLLDAGLAQRGADQPGLDELRTVPDDGQDFNRSEATRGRAASSWRVRGLWSRREGRRPPVRSRAGCGPGSSGAPGSTPTPCSGRPDLPDAASREVLKLGHVASRLAGKHAFVNCWSNKSWARLRPGTEAVRARLCRCRRDHPSRKSRHRTLPVVCQILGQVIDRSAQQPLFTAWAVTVLAHEPAHASGVEAENRAECRAIETEPLAAELLGIPKALADGCNTSTGAPFIPPTFRRTEHRPVQRAPGAVAQHARHRGESSSTDPCGDQGRWVIPPLEKDRRRIERWPAAPCSPIPSRSEELARFREPFSGPDGANVLFSDVTLKTKRDFSAALARIPAHPRSQPQAVPDKSPRYALAGWGLLPPASRGHPALTAVRLPMVPDPRTDPGEQRPDHRRRHRQSQVRDRLLPSPCGHLPVRSKSLRRRHCCTPLRALH